MTCVNCNVRAVHLGALCDICCQVIEPTVDPEPTDASPGSAEKLEVLILRASRNERLWHPDDEPGWTFDNIEKLHQRLSYLARKRR